MAYAGAATDSAATDGPSNPISYSLGGTDAAAFTINASTGAVTLTGNPNFETQPSYSFDVVATDAAGNAVTQTVTLAINERVDASAPVTTSGRTAAATLVDSRAGHVVSTAAATASAASARPPYTTRFRSGGTDAAAFTINASTGAVTLTGNPDFEAQPSYSFDVVATDAAGNAVTQTVTLAINDLVDTTAQIGRAHV